MPADYDRAKCRHGIQLGAIALGRGVIRVIKSATSHYPMCNMRPRKRLDGPDPEADEFYMRLALREARRGQRAGEVPIGAVVVASEVIGRGFNRPIGSSDPTAHAEIVAIRSAARRLRNYRLVGATLYVTLEPCVLCVGALMQARVARLVYGAAEPKFGAVRSMARAEDLPGNHRFDVHSGVLEGECRRLMTAFFRRRRGAK